MTDGEGRVWTYEFGAFEVLQAIVDPKGGRLAFSYDSEGRPTAVGNAVGQIYRLVRDVAGRVVLEEDFDGRRTRYTRDPGGRVIETVKPDGARLVHSYDRTDKVTRIESFAPGGGPGARPQDITRFWYDGRGLLEKAENGSSLIEYRRDRNGAVIAEALNGRWVESRLDAMGRRIERRIPGSSPGTSSLDGSVDWDRATTWHHEPESFRPLAKETPDGDLLYIVNDHLGTPREMFDEAGKQVWGAEYRLWGDIKRLWKP
ncbi:Putative deoxyribonuclease RhsC [Labrys miyagiensis]